MSSVKSRLLTKPESVTQAGLVLPRRRFLAGAAGLLGAGLLGGCDRFAATDEGRRVLRLGEDANLFVQRLLLSPASLAREFPDSEISPWFKPNGSIDPPDRDYKRLAAGRFADYRLAVDGLVERPLSLSLVDLRALPARTQVTRHDCVEGWSCIGKWTGVPLAEILKRAGLKPQARYAVFHCADTLEYAGSLDGASLRPETPSHVRHVAAAGEGADAWGGTDSSRAGSDSSSSRAGSDSWGGGDPEADEAPKGTPIRYYESIDLVDAVHPQTILAYDMNGQALPVSNGAPLRLRLERQLGYKMAKYVMRVELVDTLAALGAGSGGYWEDRGYEWYAGI